MSTENDSDSFGHHHDENERFKMIESAHEFV